MRQFFALHCRTRTTRNTAPMGNAASATDNFVIIPSPMYRAIFRMPSQVCFSYHFSVQSTAPSRNATDSTSLLMLPEKRIKLG